MKFYSAGPMSMATVAAFLWKLQQKFGPIPERERLRVLRGAVELVEGVAVMIVPKGGHLRPVRFCRVCGEPLGQGASKFCERDRPDAYAEGAMHRKRRQRERGTGKVDRPRLGTAELGPHMDPDPVREAAKIRLERARQLFRRGKLS